MKSLFNSPKTSVAIVPAVGVLLVEIGNALQGSDVNFEAIGMALSVIWVALFARDHDVTSEQAGAK